MKCKNPNCYRESIVRGLCKCCYDAVSRCRRMGLLTWEEVEAKGMSLAAQPVGRPMVVSDKEIERIILAAYPERVPSRAAFVEAIGGSEAILSRKYKEKLNKAFPGE